MKELNYRLDQFEGPLDLLLTLIEKNKLNIADIPIAVICDQYLEYIEGAKALDLDIASDFIVMASHLMLIKSKLLLPQDKEEVKVLKEELQDTLALYQQAKLAVEELKPRWTEYSGRMEKDEDDIPPEKGAILGLEPQILSRALNIVFARLRLTEESPKIISPLIKSKIYSVEERIEKTVETLKTRGESTLFYLLKDSESKAEVIAYFMGILELIKLRRIFICDGGSDDFYDTINNDECGISLSFRLNEDYIPQEKVESEFDDGKEQDK